MKKMIKLSLLLVVVIALCTACDGDVTRALRHEGFNVGQDFVCEPFFREEGAEQIRYLTSDRIITTNGGIYELSLGQKYSNNSHCKIAETELKVAAIMDDHIIKATDGNFYYLNGQNNSAPYQQITASDNSYALYELLLKPEGTIKVVTADSSTGLYYVLKSDGNVYGININKQNYNTPPAITGTMIVYSKDDFGGMIADFGYSGQSGATFVRTESKVFRMKPINGDQCLKYADVPCQYELMEATAFEENRDSILAYNGSMIITTYKKTFTLGS